MRKYAVLAALCGFGMLGASLALAQETLSSDQVRTRIMDSCMLALSREVPHTTPTYPACQCYATGLIKVMEQKDFVAYARTQQVPSRLTPQAKDIYTRCRG